MVYPVIFEFAKSRSGMYEFIVEKCRSFPGFTFDGLINTVSTDSSELFENWELFAQIVSTAGGWKTFTMKVDGNIFRNKEFWKFYYQLKRLRDCYEERSQVEYPELYCKKFNWCCSQITSLSLDPSSWRGIQWYKAGHFNDSYSKWIIHKKDIRRTLLMDVAKGVIDACPAFIIENIDIIIESLPDEIDLKGNRQYKVEYEKVYSGSKIVELPSSITHFGVDDDEIYTDFDS